MTLKKSQSSGPEADTLILGLVSNAVSGQEWEKLGLDVARMLAAWKGSD